MVSNDQNGVELSFGAQSSTIRPLLPTALVAAREVSRNSFGSAFSMDTVILNTAAVKRHWTRPRSAIPPLMELPGSTNGDVSRVQ